MNDLRPAAGTLVQASAKLNLDFEVLGKRGDGFHEILSFMVPIDLSDDLLFVPAENSAIECHAAWAPGLIALGHATSVNLPPSEQNLATRAVRLLQQRSGITGGGTIFLRKRAPLAAGLGGGSADAAAALHAANRAWGLNWSNDQLADIAAELGSDIPFFVTNWPAASRGRGEQIEPIAGLPTMHAVVVKPPVGLNTAEVYGCCTDDDYAADKQVADDRLQGLMARLKSGDRRDLGKWLQNGLRRAAASLSQWIDRWCVALQAWGAVAVQMTGSGSCCFAVCRSRRHARRMATALGSRNQGRVIFVRAGQIQMPHQA
jgi:4-diphosphocytidyl-2-C-methyl-D-erythritol kinase